MDLLLYDLSGLKSVRLHRSAVCVQIYELFSFSLVLSWAYDYFCKQLHAKSNNIQLIILRLMKGIKFAAAALCASMMLTSCGDWSNKGKGGLIGGGAGAALGSLVGYLISKDGKGTAIGAAVGAAVGGGAGVIIGNRMDKAKAEAERVANAKAEVLQGENGVKYVRVTFDSGILFGTGNSTLSPSAQSSLRKFAKDVLVPNSDMDVSIMGYTDNQGWRNSTTEQSREKNQMLSYQRAQSVSNYLMQNGARSAQIREVKGLGEEFPVADNGTDAGKQQNRRVEVYLYASQQMIQNAEAQAR